MAERIQNSLSMARRFIRLAEALSGAAKASALEAAAREVRRATVIRGGAK
jgi:hypothetical protein